MKIFLLMAESQIQSILLWRAFIMKGNAKILYPCPTSQILWVLF